MFDVDDENIWFYDDLVGEIEAEWFGGVSVKMFKEAQDSFDGKDYNLRIDSPGGDVRAALSIFNLIRGYSGKVTAIVDSWAASSLSYIPMAADRVLMADNALMMTHAPWTFAYGNAADLMQVVDALDSHQSSLAKGYAEKTGKTVEQVNTDLMDGENWFTADEAVEYGLADEVIESGVKIQNRVNPKVYAYKGIPDEWRDSTVQRFAAKAEKPIEMASTDKLQGVRKNVQEMLEAE